MAMLNYSSKSSSNFARKTSTESSRRSNTQASAYAVNANTMALTGFHFSSTPGGQAAGWNEVYTDAICLGGFEAPPGGVPSPPPSPDAAPVGRPSLRQRKRSTDAASHIMEECERLFCETLKTTFLVEKDVGLEDSLMMDLRNTHVGSKPIPQPPQSTTIAHGQPTPSASPDGRNYPRERGLIRECVEIWDYVAGARFRGFVAEKEDMRTMCVFFDKDVVGMDLKPGLMSLLELASSDHFDCTDIVICIDRNADSEDFKDLTRSLNWVGFELTMLEAWTGSEGCISDRYVFLGMDV